MKTNYEDIYNRINAIIQAIPLLEKENNIQKIENLKKEVIFYNTIIKNIINSKEQVNKPSDIMDKIKLLENKYTIMMGYKKLYLLNKDFYEQLGINKLFYRIDNPSSLEEFNVNLNELLKILEKYNITILKEDFNYTEYVKKYMSSFIDFRNDDNFMQKMKNIFDGIHWEDQSVLENISINIKKVFSKYEKNINDLTQKQLEEYSVSNNINQDEIKSSIESLKNEIVKLKETEPYYIKQQFLNIKVSPLNYTKDSQLINNAFLYFNPNYNNLDEYAKKQFMENVYYLKYDLDEYNELIKYDFILQNAKKIIDEDDIGSNNYDITIKELTKTDIEYDKISKQLSKLNEQKSKTLGKNTMTFITEKSKLDKVSKIDETIKKLSEQLDNLSTKIKNLQKDKVELKFNKTLLDMINENTKIFDVLNLYSENNIVLYECIKEKYNVNKIDDIEKIVTEFNNYIDYSNIKIINNINFSQFGDIKSIIENKYKLLNIIFNLDDLNNVFNNANNIYLYRNILTSNIDVNTLFEELENK